MSGRLDDYMPVLHASGRQNNFQVCERSREHFAALTYKVCEICLAANAAILLLAVSSIATGWVTS